MPVVEMPSVLTGISVSEAMRRQVISHPSTADIGQGIRMMIRYKVNAVLLTEGGIPCGVVSKTDLLGAFYAELPTQTPLGDVIGGQPIACFPDDPLEDALEIMEAAGVHRLYVIGAHRHEVTGIVAYSDIVGLLYRYCRACERGTARREAKRSGNRSALLAVKDVMTPDVHTCRDSDPLSAVAETLSTQRVGAVLIQDDSRSPIGVLSKTDLILAYLHGVPPQTEARKIMSAPVRAIAAGELLSRAIQEMLVRDIQRLFVHRDAAHPESISGVLALSDAARFRSGSCRACTAGRILTR